MKTKKTNQTKRVKIEKQKITLKENITFKGRFYKKGATISVTKEELKGFLPAWY